MQQPLWVCQLGVIEYLEALKLQNAVRAARQAHAIPDVMLLLEHEAVYTRGRRADDNELPFGEDWYLARGIDIVDSNRGGKVTYHGPGQLVSYPIMEISDVIVYLRTMETAMIDALGAFGVDAQMREGLTGVWVGERKIGSIGVHVSRAITTHGFSINVENDLEPFSWIRPCGLDGTQTTSVAAQVGGRDLMGPMFAQVAQSFAAAHQREPVAIDVEQLHGALVALAGGVWAAEVAPYLHL